MNIQVTRLFFLSIAFIFALILTLLWILGSSYTDQELLYDTPVLKDIANIAKPETQALKMSKDQWKNVNLFEETIPKEIQGNVKKVVVEQLRVKIQNYDVFYRKASPSQDAPSSHQEVLLLHGMRFKSQTWLELSTIQLLAAMGHKVTAIDIPGYGESSKEHVPEAERGEFLHQLITSLKLQRPVIVSPSLSGSFTVPLLGAHPELIGGYVPVAPIKTDLLTPEQYKKIEIPTLIVYGEKDKDLGEESRKNLGNIPTSQVQVLPNAGHPAYLDQPEMFHQLLYNFLKRIESLKH